MRIDQIHIDNGIGAQASAQAQESAQAAAERLGRVRSSALSAELNLEDKC